MLTVAAGRPESICRLSPPTAIAGAANDADDHLERLVSAEPAGEEADVAVAGEEARAELELGAGELDQPAEAGERAADDHGADEQQQPDLAARPGGPPRGCRRPPGAGSPTGRA